MCCDLYVRSPQAGERVRTFLRKPYTQLPLRINEERGRTGVAPAGPRARRWAWLGRDALPAGGRPRPGREEGPCAGDHRTEPRTERTAGRGGAAAGSPRRGRLFPLG